MEKRGKMVKVQWKCVRVCVFISVIDTCEYGCRTQSVALD